MLPANPAQAYGYLKAPAPSKLYGQAAIMHSSDNCGGFPCHQGQDGGRAYGHDRNTLWAAPWSEASVLRNGKPPPVAGRPVRHGKEDYSRPRLSTTDIWAWLRSF